MSSSNALSGQLHEHLTQLRLPTFRECFEPEAVRATQESLGYEQYLLELATREVEDRCRRRIAKNLRESRLPLEKDLTSFDLKRLPRKVQMQVRALLKGEVLDRRENVLAFGNPGSGKTHLVSALAQELIRKDKRVYFSSCALLWSSRGDKRDPELLLELRGIDGATDGGSAIDIKIEALKQGMITLRRCAILNAIRGKTSIEEVLRVTLVDRKAHRVVEEDV